MKITTYYLDTLLLEAVVTTMYNRGSMKAAEAGMKYIQQYKSTCVKQQNVRPQVDPWILLQLCRYLRRIIPLFYSVETHSQGSEICDV